jgi:hypothetical protein
VLGVAGSNPAVPTKDLLTSYQIKFDIQIFFQSLCTAIVP